MKFIVVPHTHWDREWYFTNEVSDALLKYNLDNFLHQKGKLDYFYLDAQISILEDYLSYASDQNRKKIVKLIRDGKIIVGPLYSQPDVFNSLGETTLRNAMLASDYLEKHDLPNNDVFYCPDTFGFGRNFPQIIKYLGFDNFVFWRGLSKEYSHSDYNLWKGIDGSEINTYRMKFGYGKISHAFPWYKLNKKNINELAKTFLDYFNNAQRNHFQEQSKLTNGVAIIPFGNDQSPIHPLATEFFEQVNKISKDEWVIGNFNDFFKKNKKAKNIIDGRTDYGFESKIHRTITSTRYDFKKLFRENEIELYHQLEPLEMIYKTIDKNYQIDNLEIMKKITCMQAHDILGGCVSDNTYQASYQKLLNTQDSIITKKEIIMKQIANEMDLDSDHILIFNPNYGENQNNFKIIKIYTSKKIKGSYSDEKIEVVTLDSKSYDKVENSYETKLIILNKNLDNLFWTVFDLKKLKKNNIEKQEYKDYDKFLNFKIIYDNGDLFDADPEMEKAPQFKTEIKSSKIIIFDAFQKIKISGELLIDDIANHFSLNVLVINKKHYYHLEIVNKVKNIIVKWIPPVNFQKNLSFLQHLGIINYEFKKIENWKSMGYLENPMNLQKNSGIIFDNNSFITTRGTNQFQFENNELEITLYRSTGILGKRDLKNRPGVASGIDGHIIETPLGQLLHKKLVFDFSYGQYDGDVANELNNFYKTPIVYHHNSLNLIHSFLQIFIFIKKNLKIEKQKIKLANGFISSSFWKNNQMNFLIVDFNKNSKDFNKMKKKIIKL